MLRKWLIFSNFIVIMVIGGYLAYLTSTLIPIPGSKFLVMGPFLTLVLMIPLERFPKFGTLSLINLVFGMILLMLTPWMTLAIVVSGFTSDLIMLLPVKHWFKRVFSLGIYNLMSFYTSLYVTHVITGNLLYNVIGPIAMVAVGVLCLILGMTGAYLGRLINKKYLGKIN